MTGKRRKVGREGGREERKRETEIYEEIKREN